MTRRLELEISESVWSEVQRIHEDTGENPSRIVDSALSRAFDLDRHSLFQVSTSNALAQGVFAGAVTVGELRRHGDFGLGTFAGLDGELVMVDGECFRATGGGVVVEADDALEVPFALVTRFAADVIEDIETVTGIEALERELDRARPSENLFAGIRIEAELESLAMRAACPARPGEGLLEATRHQSEFTAGGARGTLVGFWAPQYARSVGIPGYHFHFISEDRTIGGHVLDLIAGAVRAEVQTESELHLAIPETVEFLTADLSGDHREAIEAAETQTSRPSQDR
jgi:acetolactate decarboxylase